MDHVIVPEPEPVPPSPYHLDLNTHDVPKSISASKIHAMLLETFDTNKCDILFKTNSWTFICKNYSNNGKKNIFHISFDTTCLLIHCR